MVQNENNVPMVKRFVLLPVKGSSKGYMRRINGFLEDKVHKLTDYGCNDWLCSLETMPPKVREAEEELIAFHNSYEPSDKVVVDYTSSLIIQASASEAERKNVALRKAKGIMENRGEELALLYRFAHGDEKQEATKRFNNETHKIVNASFDNCWNTWYFDKEGADEYDKKLAEENTLGFYGFDWIQQLKNTFWKLVSDGLLSGKVVLPYLASDLSFTVSTHHIGFSSDYNSQEETLANWSDSTNLYLCYGFNAHSTICDANDDVAKFKIDVDSCDDKTDALDTLKRIYSGEYRVGTSKIAIDDSYETITVDLVVAPRSFKGVL